MLISLPSSLEEQKINKIAALCKCSQRSLGKRTILKYSGANLQALLEIAAPVSFNSQFVVGLLESDLSIFYSATRSEKTQKYITARQYIQFQNHPIIAKYLEKSRLPAPPEKAKIRLTTGPHITAFLANFQPIYFNIYKDEVENLKKFAVKTNYERFLFYDKLTKSGKNNNN